MTILTLKLFDKWHFYCLFVSDKNTIKNMKKVFFALIIGFSFASCNNEIDLFAEWENIPVVYGLIEADGNDQYIRIERVFQGEEGNAFDAANNVDSIYYNDDTYVTLTNNTTGQFTELEKTEVSATNGWDREDGLFLRDPNFLYKLNKDELSFEPGDELNLAMYNAVDDTPFTEASTIVLEPVDYQESSNKILSFRPGKPTGFTFEHGPNAKIFDLIIYLNITEVNGSEITEKTIKWIVTQGDVIPDNGSPFYSFSILGDGFYSILLSQLEKDPAINRFFGTMSVEFIVAGNELKEFNEIALVNTGITSAQVIPTYSNLSNGLGILSSKASSIVDELVLSEVALDTLRNSELTAELNFF